MKSVRIFEAEHVPWIVVREAVTPDIEQKMSDAELDSQARIHHPGTDVEPQLFEVRIDPDQEVSLHAHEQDEIIYVLEGELHLGQRVLGPGASVFVSGETLYGFRSGPEGLHFLNFRPRTDTCFLSREEYMSRRAESRNGSTAD